MARKHVPPEKRKKGEYNLYIRERERIEKKRQWCIKKMKEEFIIISNDIVRRAKEDFEYCCENAIDKWYDAYQPNRYRRKLSLYQIPQSEITKGKYRQKYGKLNITDEKMTRRHRVSNEYIFYNSFIHGWHGGADLLGPNPAPGYEMPHPHPRTGDIGYDNTSGVPYWRFPAVFNPDYPNIYKWMFWSVGPAIKTESPYEYLNRIWLPKVKQYNDELLNRLLDMRDKYKKIFIDYYNKNKRW